MSLLTKEANIYLGLQALEKDPQLTPFRASKMFKVSRHTLERQRNGISARRDIVSNSRKLSDLGEQTLVKYILDLDSRGFPPRLRGVEEMAN
jgi:hypothetical protein